MPEEKAFNPIEIPSIALTLALEILEQPVFTLPLPSKPVGAGVYVLYYCGNFEPYEALAVSNHGGNPKLPIYIGKAERKGKRKGIVFSAPAGAEIASRLGMHVKSIETSTDLNVADFKCRYLRIEDSFIGLAESVLVSIFNPLWNTVLDGFGNNPTGEPRGNQAMSKWDSFHPGRRRGLGNGKHTKNELEEMVKQHFSATKPQAEERLRLIHSRIEKYGLG